MDIFYYWRDYEKDIEQPDQTLGRFVSGENSFIMLNSRGPEYLWAFKTPKGYKSRIQLLARLRWSAAQTVSLPLPVKLNIRSTAYFDPQARDSMIYTDTGSDAAIDHMTQLMAARFPSAFARNFSGTIEPMENSFLISFYREIARYSSEPFWPVRSSVLKKAIAPT